MDEALLEVVLKRLDQVPLDENAESVLLAACDGEAMLADQLSGGTGQAEASASTPVRPQPAGAYLRSITAAGFRGVGAAATLAVEPGPGLTLVVGRNGSGKSSFAEALEVLLTGNLRRWKELTTVWREGWRNLHQTETLSLSAELLLEDAGRAKVRRWWDPGARLDQSHADLQVAGGDHTSLDELGWRDALVTFRPFLSHSELETLVRGPSELYDLLSAVLGLDDLDVAEKRLNAARKQREDAVKAVRADLPGLLSRLAGCDDERARACAAALSGRAPEVAVALAIATGSAGRPPGGALGRLRMLGQLSAPSGELAQLAAARLSSAADGLALAAGSDAGQALELAGLLKAALQHYHAQGDGPCPVCGRAGALDKVWRDRTEQHVSRLEATAARAREARSAAADAIEGAREILRPVPAVLTEPAAGAADPGAARLAWAAWAEPPPAHGPEGLRRLAAHIEGSWPGLSQAVAALVRAAETELSILDDAWTPLAGDVARWCARAQDAADGAGAVPALKAAIAWLKKATDDIRNERLAPLGEQARAIWSELRQESNVDLGAIRLSGSATRRQVDVKVTVDGSGGTALGVMSQGEVNALALSIFLPRATVAASPFRFLVIDDPVQAMDPAKVEGLARVLHQVAQHRQVLVFTHDDRLPEAVRRLGLSGRILEVARRPGSIVEVRPALSPVRQLIKDARDLCADPELPDDVAARVVPGLCRLAVEAAFIEAARREQLAAGLRHAELEAQIQAAEKLSKKAALAIFADTARASEVPKRLRSWHPRAADTYQALNKGAHRPHRGSLRTLVDDAQALTDLIGQKLT
jgi:recombinational DNA repair ATPase RecF